MEQQSITGSTWQVLVCIIIVQLFGYHLWALDPGKTVDRYLVDQWEMFEGIPSNSVLSITQTLDGYLWVGTSKGLVRFDGVKFAAIRFSDKEEIYAQDISHLHVDRGGALWIGSVVGLTLYNSSKNRFKNFTGSDGIIADGIRCIIDDTGGNTWISFTASYAARFVNGKFTAFNESHGLLCKRINAIVEDRQGNLLFGTRENGIFTYRGEKFSKYPVAGLENHLIVDMHEDRNGTLWIGTNKGLFRVNRLTGKGTRKYTVRDGLTHNYVTSITEDSEGNLWAGTRRGLNRIEKKPDGEIGFESLLNSFLINCLFEDREKSLWIGTDNAGIKRLKDGKFETYAPFAALMEATPLSLYEDRHGDTWIGTYNGKLLRCQGRELVESAAVPGASGVGIAAIAGDAEGNLWLGTIGKGVFQKKKNRFVRFTTRQGLVDNLVTSITKDSRDNLWFSTFNGVSVLRSGNRIDRIIESFNAGDGLSGKVVHNVYEDRDHNIWIAADKGITVLKDGKVEKQNITYYLPGVSVSCIYEDPSAPDEEGRVFWIATDGKGLNRLSLKDGTVTSYTTANGMTTNFIYQFLEDSQGKFWFMSNSGILRVGKSELDRMARGSVDKVNCISYGISDGLKSREFDNEFSPNSALKAGNGQFLFITKKGIAAVNPANIRLNKNPPPVVIEAVFFNHRPVSLHPDGGPVTFKGITDFSFHFTAPTFLSPGKVKFKYKLDGFDREWKYLPPGSERVARYQDLEPGTYTFSVDACNAEGVWNQTGDSMTFSLKPFFSQTFLFKLAVLLLLITLAAAFYLYKKKRPPFGKRVKYKSAPLNPYFAEECITKLKYLMEVDKVYCDAGITLQSLAEKMSIAPYQLSQLLNEKMNRNFADFINGYRIEEAKKILRSPRGSKRKISAIAIELGFNTMSAFYKVFKKHTGTTPTEYKKKPGNKHI